MINDIGYPGDIIAGQQIFLGNLGNRQMEYGSIFGHGAYLGPDFLVPPTSNVK